MIKSEREYQNVKQKLLEERVRLDEAKSQVLLETQDENIVNDLMAPLETFYIQLKFELEQYEEIKSGNIDIASNFGDVGKQLIALRIAMGITQSELSVRLGYSEAQVSRDEKNEYYNAGTEKLDSVMTALDAKAIITMELPFKFKKNEDETVASC
jgi:hypothetical protein